MTTENSSSSALSVRARRSTTQRRRAESRFAFWLVLPTVILLSAVIASPIIQAIWRSLFSDTITGKISFIGIQNYLSIFIGSSSSQFWDAMGSPFFSRS
ncbi:hypothetical protein [Rathayibacter toxicus]|uniref:hypothetical protein n=1 Tax=Rathayibacter toxicus TaxID=145458 RepID=UPI003B8A5BC8